MKKNPALLEQPNCGHYDVCCTRMTQIKSFTVRTFVFSSLTSGAMLIMTLLGISMGPFSLLPSLFGENYSVGYISAQAAELLVMAVLSIVGYIRFKECNIALFIIYVLGVLAGIANGLDCIKTVGFAAAAFGAALTYPCFNACADYKQLLETEGYPYFNRLFAETEDNEYQALHMEGYRNLKKNPERRFGDIAPIPLTPDEMMTDLKDVPRAEPLVKRENHLDEVEGKSYFKEV